MKRERSNSVPIMNFIKRGEKRKGIHEEEMEGKEIEAFKRSTRVERSPTSSPAKPPVEAGEERWKEVIKEMKMGFSEIMKEMKILKEGKEEMKKWMEEMRKEWEKEKEGWERRVGDLEKKLGEWERREKGKGKGERERGEEGKGSGEKWEEVEGRMRRLEMEGERKRREERKRNVIIRGVRAKKEGGEGLKEEVEEVIKETGAIAKIEAMRRIGRKNGEGKEMVWVRFTSVEEKVEVMKGKRRLRDRREWITDDLTEKERGIEWMIRREAERKRREGMRVRVGYMKMWVEGRLWMWDEGREGWRTSEGGEVKGKEGEERMEGGKSGEVFCLGDPGEEEKRGKKKRDEKGKKKKKERGRSEEEEYKIGFWNVAGLENKDKEFWEKLKEWDVMILSETWVQEKGWERIKRRMPKGFVWEVQEAGRKNRKGRAMGGMVVGRKEEIEVRGEGEGRERREEGIMMKEMKIGGKWWRIVGVYVNKDIDRKMEKLREWMENKEEGMKVLIGGDFNARTGREGGRVSERSEEGAGKEGRRSRDKRINGDGRKLCGVLEELGWSILNGNIEGDEEGEWTYTGGKNGTVIDYVLGNEETREGVKRMKVEERIDSDHQPLTVWVEGREKREKRKGRKEKKGGKGVWTEEGRKRFGEYFGRKEEEGREGEEEWEKLKERVGKVVERVERELKVKRKRGWWDEECREKKGEVKEELKRWKKQGGEGEKYKEAKREYRMVCEKKRREERERWEREMEKVKTERQVWKVVRGERRGRRGGGMGQGIEMEEWERYFKDLMGGVEWRIRREREERGRGEMEEEEISKEEVERAIRILKDGKTAGGDGIGNEVWKYGGKEVREWLWQVCNRVWKGEGWPEDWREGVVIPILKKGKGGRVEDYRGVTLTQTAYKIYAAILAERLREEIERKGLLPPSQTGFRKGMGTIDQIYVLNYMINKRVVEGRGKMVAMFIDMKAAFDSVDRGILVESMRERGVREGLVARCEEVLEETVGRVRVGEKEGGRFWTERGVRQGCPLSPCLFTLMIADLDEALEKEGWGGVKVKGRRIYSLAYADDVVVLAEEENGMRRMIKGLERYVDGKGLEVNVEKTKVMRCRKGGGRWKKIEWKWKGKEVEEVKKFKYLGYTLMANGGQREHIRERVRKGAVVMREVWGIGKRRFGKDWARRMWLFDRLVWTVMGYGVEIWGWKEREEVEKVQDRFLKWVAGVERSTPSYMVREEFQREKLRGRAGLRAWGYERRLGEGRGGELARLCWKELRERAKEGSAVGKWERERKEYYEEKGWSLKEIEKMREEGEMRGEEIVRKERETQEKERWERIGESKYNKWYGRIKGKGVPEYLKKGWKEERWQRVARHRLGDGLRGNRYWEDREGRKCRRCGWGEETWEHIWEECTSWGQERGWQEAVGEVLGERGEGEEWMKKWEEMREGKEEERTGGVNEEGME